MHHIQQTSTTLIYVNQNAQEIIQPIQMHHPNIINIMLMCIQPMIY